MAYLWHWWREVLLHVPHPNCPFVYARDLDLDSAMLIPCVRKAGHARSHLAADGTEF